MAPIKSKSLANSRAYQAAHLARAASLRRQAHWLAGDLRRQAINEHAAAICSAKGERAYWKAGYRLPA